MHITIHYTGDGILCYIGSILVSIVITASLQTSTLPHSPLTCSLLIRELSSLWLKKVLSSPPPPLHTLRQEVKVHVMPHILNSPTPVTCCTINHNRRSLMSV